MNHKSDFETRLEKLEKSSDFLRIQEKIVNFCLTLLSVAMSIFVIGVLIVFTIKMLLG